MNKLKQIIQLSQQGHGAKRISTISGIARNSVRYYLRRLRELRISQEDLNALNESELQQLFQPYKHAPLPDPGRHERLEKLIPLLDKELRKRGVTLKKAHEFYLTKDPAGYSRTQFYRYMRDFRSCLTGTSMHIEHKAGDKMYVDFTGKKLFLTNTSTGEITEVEVFVAILGCSQLTYVEATMRQDLYCFVDCMRNALHYFGGVPGLIVPDNLKAAVTKSSKYEPVINEVCAAFAEHYGTHILPARPYKPKDKSLVEGAVKIVYQRIFSELDKNIYTSLELLNGAIGSLLSDYNNGPFKNDQTRRGLFETEEKQALLPLPVLPFTPSKVKEYKVNKMGYVPLHEDRRYYSVPYQLIGKRVKVVYNSLTVKVYHKDQIVGEHQRCTDRRTHITVKDHLASNHRVVTEWNQEFFISKGNAIAPQVGQYLETLMNLKEFPEIGYGPCRGILNLARKVGKQRISDACEKATRLGVFNMYIIKDLLIRGIEKDEPEQPQRATPAHKNLRGKDYYSQNSNQ